jgi:1,2-phenylacetyl-CoA epoxidase catalytic subunit
MTESPARGSRQTIWDDDAALAALVNLVAVLADNKYYFGRALSEWAVGAPTMEDAVGCAAIAQEELGHCRALYPLLNQLPFEGGPTPLERGGERRRRYCVSYLDDPLSTWPQLVAALLLVDTAMLVLIESLVGSTYDNLASRVRRMPGEERFHADFAEGRVREITDFERGIEELRVEVDRLLPEMLCWFGPPGEPGVGILKEKSLISADNEEMRQSFLSRIGPLLTNVGIDVAMSRRDSGEGWEYADLPWDRWNGLQRRLTTAPAS